MHCSSASTAPIAKRFLIELNNRFAFPAACLVLMLVGVPLGVASRRGGKSSGFVFTILLVFLYYFLSSIGIALGRQNKLPAFLAVWSANLLFAAVGIFLLWQMASGGQVLERHHQLGLRATPKPAGQRRDRPAMASRLPAFSTSCARRPQRAKSRNAFPRILDEYVVREFLSMFLLVLAGFVLLMLVFTFFDLVGDILRNHIPLTTVGAYLVNLTPDMLYQIAPLAVLIAVLVTFGVLNRNSEIIAMKATGISLYRLVIPIVSICRHPVRQPVSLRSVLSAPGQPPAGGAAQHHQGPPAADRSASRAELDLRPAPSRRARPHLLLPVLRSRPQGVRQPLRLRVRSIHLLPHAPHLCRARLLGRRQQTPGASRTAGCAT